MKVGVHYHIPIHFDPASNNYYIAGFFGVFLEGLAKEIDELILFLYEALPTEVPQCNFQLTITNFKLISLGKHNSVPWRMLRGWQFYRLLRLHLPQLDVMLVRTPTPMIIVASLIRNRRVVPYIVGEYEEAKKTPLTLKGRLIRILFALMEAGEKKIAARNLAITNSRLIRNRMEAKASQMEEVKTTTSSNEDAYKRLDTCENKRINLIFTGRLDPRKNLPAVFEAVKDIQLETSFDLHLNLAYLESPFATKYAKELRDLAIELGIAKVCHFHGQKKVGEELNQMYRSSDLFIIASVTEGFPRVIWEAMINSLPVIATRVGSIPYYLNHRTEAFLIDPGSSQQIKEAIVQLITDKKLRQRLIQKGYEMALNNTVEIQSRKLVSILRQYQSYEA